MPRLTGQVAIVTGAASGLGRAISEAFVAEGAVVAVTDISDGEGMAVAKSLGAKAIFIHHDVTSESDWKHAIARTVEHFGKLDTLVNNAGITLLGSIESLSLEDWNKTLAVDLTGVFLGCKLALPAMKLAGGGAIINISSMLGLKAEDDCVAYNAAKSGVTLMTKSIALHCARQRHNIRCNSIHPGVIRTPILEKVLAQVRDPEALMKQYVAKHPIGRLGEPADVANLAIYLASSESSFVTGSSCVVDGGATL
jgi:NAD(P)-dependent dehydrogenase (short-subunit alcohol dehydrogenase family)